MIQPNAVAVYAWLDEWSDGDLSSLASRMRGAPQDQVRAMVESWPRAAHELDALDAGKLRPLVSDALGTDEMVRSGLRLLLYTEAIILDSDLLNPYTLRIDDPWFDPLELSAVLEQLAVLRPLVADGSLLFTDSRDFFRGVHPSRHFSYLDAVRSVGVDLWDQSEMIPGLGPDQMIRSMAGSLAAVEQRKATPLALTKNEQLTYDAVIGGRTLDARPAELRKLARLSVPDFSADLTELVTLRQHSDSLQEFRNALDQAMAAVATVPDSVDGGQEASALMAEVLSGKLEAVIRDSNQSAISVPLRHVVRTLGFTGVGATAEAVALGTVDQPISGALIGAASGVAMGVAEVLHDFAETIQHRRGARAIGEVITSFRAT
jgi:hypothetical protein